MNHYKRKYVDFLYQKDLSDTEKYIAIIALNNFINKCNKVNGKLSWKHMTNGGHKKGMPYMRRVKGLLLSYFSEKLGLDKAIGSMLVFRRHGTNHRQFAVQRVCDLVIENSESGNNCICASCDGGKRAKSNLKNTDFMLHQRIYDEEIGNEESN